MIYGAVIASVICRLGDCFIYCFLLHILTSLNVIHVSCIVREHSKFVFPYRLSAEVGAVAEWVKLLPVTLNPILDRVLGSHCLQWNFVLMLL